MAGTTNAGREATALLQALGEELPSAFVLLPDEGAPIVSAPARRLLERHLLDAALLTDPDGPAAPGMGAARLGSPVQGLLLATPGGTASLAVDFLPVPGGVLVRLDASPIAPEFLSFFQHSSDLLCVADHEGQFIRLSPSWADCLGWDLPKLIGRPFLDFVHPDDHAGTRREAKRLAQHKEVVRFENRYRCRDGTYRWLQWNAVSPPGGPVYAVARDVTDQHNTTTRLHAAYEVLQDAEQRRLQIFRHVVHDIATPLSAMGLQLALMDGGDGRNDVERLQRVHEHLQRLLQDLRDLSLVESERLRLRREPAHAQDLLHPTLDALRGAAQARNIELEHRVEDVVLDVDPLRFNQIVYNLVTNALRFTPPGGRVRVSAKKIDRTARLTVEDDGPGLDPHEAQRLFEPFVQLHEDGGRGSGLGLYICKQLTEAHGGRIWVESGGRGAGSRFHVELPAVAAPVAV